MAILLGMSLSGTLLLTMGLAGALILLSVVLFLVGPRLVFSLAISLRMLISVLWWIL
jgi:hypothetical protein